MIEVSKKHWIEKGKANLCDQDDFFFLGRKKHYFCRLKSNILSTDNLTQSNNTKKRAFQTRCNHDFVEKVNSGQEKTSNLN